MRERRPSPTWRALVVNSVPLRRGRGGDGLPPWPSGRPTGARGVGRAPLPPTRGGREDEGCAACPGTVGKAPHARSSAAGTPQPHLPAPEVGLPPGTTRRASSRWPVLHLLGDRAALCPGRPRPAQPCAEQHRPRRRPPARARGLRPLGARHRLRLRRDRAARPSSSTVPPGPSLPPPTPGSPMTGPRFCTTSTPRAGSCARRWHPFPDRPTATGRRRPGDTAGARPGPGHRP